MTLCSHWKIVQSRVTLPFLTFFKESCVFKASETCYADLLPRNQLKTSLWKWTSSRYYSMYSIVGSVLYQYSGTRGKYTEFLMHNRASVMGFRWHAEGCERVAVKSGTITSRSAFISLQLYCVSLLYGLLNRAKPGCWGIAARSGFNSSILEWGSKKDITQCITSLHIATYVVWRISSMIVVIGEMHFIF